MTPRPPVHCLYTLLKSGAHTVSVIVTQKKNLKTHRVNHSCNHLQKWNWQMPPCNLTKSRARKSPHWKSNNNNFPLQPPRRRMNKRRRLNSWRTACKNRQQYCRLKLPRRDTRPGERPNRLRLFRNFISKLHHHHNHHDRQDRHDHRGRLRHPRRRLHRLGRPVPRPLHQLRVIHDQLWIGSLQSCPCGRCHKMQWRQWRPKFSPLSKLLRKPHG